MPLILLTFSTFTFSSITIIHLDLLLLGLVAEYIVMLQHGLILEQLVAELTLDLGNKRIVGPQMCYNTDPDPGSALCSIWICDRILPNGMDSGS